MSRSSETPRAKLVKGYLEANPNAPSKTLARRMFAENPEAFIHLKAAYQSVLYYRGAAGPTKRKEAHNHKQNFRKLQKAGWKPSLPPSQAEPWEKYHLPAPSKILCLSDIHVPYHDETAVQAAVDYARKKLKPNVVLLNGDILDFYSISRWEKDPKKRDFLAELEVGRQFLGWLVHQFPGAKFVYKLGNHEERWDHYIWNKAADLWGMAALRIDEMLTRDAENNEIPELRHIEWVADKRPVMAASLPVLHGHELAKGLTNPVNMARGAFLRTVHSILVGHGHRSSSHVESNLWHKEISTWSQGCLCDMRPSYAVTNKWNHGFAFIETHNEKEFEVRNFRIHQGHVRQS